MKRASHIQEELAALGATMLSEASATMPFGLPSNYFSEQTDGMVAIAAGEEKSFILASAKGLNPFAAPNAAYFEGLSNSILDKIKDEEIEWSKENPFTVPQNYFEQFPSEVIAKIKDTQRQKLPTRVPLFRYVQMAAALAMLVFVGLGISHKFENNTIAKVDFSTISKVEIANYIDNNLDEFDTDMILNTLATNNNSTIIKSQDLSDEEIKSYLNEYGWN